MEPAELARRAAVGEVGALIVRHANPHGYRPVFANLAAAVEKVPFVAAFSNQLDETSRHAHLLLPNHHFLETWSDVTVRRSIAGIQQAAMIPLLGPPGLRPTSCSLPRAAWARWLASPTAPLPTRCGHHSTHMRWSAVESSASPPRCRGLWPSASSLARWRPSISQGSPMGCRWWLPPLCASFDGLPPTSALLQEMPNPLTSISWGGWVELHPTTASGLGVAQGDVLGLEGTVGRTELPAHLTIGLREGVVAVPIGYALPLLNERVAAIGFGTRVRLRKTGAKVSPPHVREGQSQHGAELAREVTPSRRLPMAPALPSVVPPFEHPLHRWGLARSISIVATAAAPAWRPAGSRATSRSSAPRRSRRDAT